MTRTSRAAGRRLRLAAAVAAGLLAAALGASGAWAAEDDASAADDGTLIIQVTVPEHGVSVPSPSGSGGALARTGLDASAVLPLLVAGLAVAGGGTAAVALRRRARSAA